MKPDNKIVIVAVLLLCAGFLVIFMPAGRIAPIDAITDENIKIFGSQEELEDFIKYSAENSGGYGGWDTRGGMLGEVAMDMAVAEAAPAPSAAKGASDFSTTNIQVEGVDEADIVKSDGKYLYVLSGKSVSIIDAYPAESAEKLSEINFSTNPSEIFINDDTLVVFSQDYYNRGYDYYGSGSNTQVYLYDVSDRSKPNLEKNITADGSYFDSRMIGDYVYVIINEPIYYRPCYPYYGGWELDLECLSQTIKVPEILVDGEALDKGFPDVYYWDFPDSSYKFTTVMAVNVKTGEKPTKKFFVMGTAQNLFVSQNNIYVTRTGWVSQQEIAERVYDEVVIPSMPSDIRAELEEVEASDKSSYRKQLERLIVIREYIANLDSSARESLERAMSEKMRELEQETISREHTTVSRIAINAGQISPRETGRVPGTVLNQFSMDEYGGNFRIATTTNKWGSDQANNLYVLDMDMEIIGKVEGIAPGESIYSVRFMGKRAYMVTFKQVDPLFVIDLSEPTAPKILGKLKIPGYSDYLHPYDENHLIGIGKEVDESIDADKIHSDNAVYYTAVQGVKLAIFDVSDVANPLEIHKEVIGDRGTQSEATNDHKAFLFDKEKGLLVVPILLAEVSEKQKEIEGWQSREGDFTFQGAYVYSISLDNGFELRGRVTHLDDPQELLKSGYYFSSPYSVKRSLYMDDVLYTVSSKKVKMNDLGDLSYVNEVELPYEDEGRYYPYWDEPEIVF
jgi:inhibitor of cysteine peptidase